MRKVEKESIARLINDNPGRSGKNDIVIRADTSVLSWRYHGNTIVTRVGREIRMSDHGYQTVATKSRLNAVLAHFGKPRIYQKDFLWYHHGALWNGYYQFEY